MVSFHRVDTVCINQDDKREKEQQVARLTQIFEEAKLVWGWLGKPEDPWQALAAVQMMRWAGGVCQWAGSRTTKNSSLSTLVSQKIAEFVDAYPENREKSVQAWKGINTFFNLHYWSRAWIYQEATTSDDPQFVWGNMDISGMQMLETFFVAMELT